MSVRLTIIVVELTTEGVLHLVVTHGKLSLELLAVDVRDLCEDSRMDRPDLPGLKLVVGDLIWEL